MYSWPYLRSTPWRRDHPDLDPWQSTRHRCRGNLPLCPLAGQIDQPTAAQKHKKYDASFEGQPYLFAAVVFETTGAINEEGVGVLRQLFRFAAKHLGVEFSSYCGRAWARLSCNLQRAVSQSILSRIDGATSVVPALKLRDSGLSNALSP